MCGLIHSPRFKPGDLEAWRRLELADLLYAQRYRAKLERMADRARATIAEFLHDGPAYCSVSWGKDSVVVADLCRDLGIPFGYIRITPYNNPDCDLVRNAFAPDHYREAVVVRPDDAECSHSSGVFEDGARLLESEFGTSRHISGIRTEESQSRRLRGSANTKNSCVPIARWTTQDVFAYLNFKNLPIHPAYAMSNGGQFSRNHLRVASIGGSRGTQFNRREWENLYYPEILWKSSISPS